MESTVKQFVILSQLIELNPVFEYMIDEFFIIEVGSDTAKLRQFGIELKKYWRKFHRDEKSSRVNQYMLTFTLDDAKIDINDEIALMAAHSDIIKCINNKQFMKNMITCHWVREGTHADGKRPHWHFGFQTAGYINVKKHFPIYLKYYGSIQMTRSNQTHPSIEDIDKYFIDDKPKNTIHVINHV